MAASRHKTGPNVRKDFITTAAPRNAATCVFAAEDFSRTITPVLHITCFCERTEDLGTSLHVSPSDALAVLLTPAPRMDNANSMPNEFDELTKLRVENARLIALLESHGIDWRHDPEPVTSSAPSPPEPSNLSTAE